MMKVLDIKGCNEKIQRLGRTYDGPRGEIYMNWTCSGVRFLFKGTCLVAEMKALSGEEMDRNPLDGTIVRRTTWPYVAIFVDDKEEPVRGFEVTDACESYPLFFSENEETHVITVRKITENPKGKLAISKLLGDGVIEKIEDGKKRLKVEFIGDSITCGFGNLSNERDRLFFSADENGWLSHAAIAARKLDAQFNIISYSGIPITKGLGNFDWLTPSMTELYPYTDRVIEERLGATSSYTRWDFNSFKPEVIVLNLGTNDATVIDFNGDVLNGIQKFEEEYYKFLEMLRGYNGDSPWIICALGSMDYYLYDNIKKIVEQFSRDKKDQKIKCFKYGRIQFMEGFGACGHPNVTTQNRMGNEIADYITELLNLLK